MIPDKKMSKPVNASELLKETMRVAEEGTEQEKKNFMEALSQSFEESGKKFISRAITDGIISMDEILERNCDYGEIGAVLHGYYSRKDGHIKKDDEIVCLTSEKSSNYKNKEWIKQRFNVIVRSLREQMILDKQKSK